MAHDVASSPDYAHKLRHSAAHLLAHAISELFPDTLLTIGPPTECGFFYDVLPKETFKQQDLMRIEKRMRKIAARGLEITGGQVPKAEARKLFAHNPFKLELIDAIEADTVGVYHQGDFYDLCRGGHVENVSEIVHFKLTHLAGSYWRADKDNAQLQRIYGIAFPTKAELDAYLKRQEEAKKYDHRKIGRELDLFSFHQEAPGMPFFHERGRRLYQSLIDYSRKMQASAYSEVKTPLILDEQFWHTSGHYQHYKEHMFFTQHEDVSRCIRPMNCPTSILLYKEKPHSYRELPLRMVEYGLVHRRELSGVLHGLMRVMAFTIDDAHIYCMPEQIEAEVCGVLALAGRMYERFGFTNVHMRLATRPEGSIGSDEQWERATEALKAALIAHGSAFTIHEGEGAFYGPKIEMHIEDVMGRTWQCGTVQLDFFLPENFDLRYIASDQSRKRPVIIHRAIYGSIERFMGILLEHYKGKLPFWLAPLQARVLVITDAQRSYAQEIVAHLAAAGVRVEVDMSSDQIGAQIRRAQLEQIPWMLIVGAQEQESGTVSLRDYTGSQEAGLTLDELCTRIDRL